MSLPTLQEIISGNDQKAESYAAQISDALVLNEDGTRNYGESAILRGELTAAQYNNTYTDQQRSAAGAALNEINRRDLSKVEAHKEYVKVLEAERKAFEEYKKDQQDKNVKNASNLEFDEEKAKNKALDASGKKYSEAYKKYNNPTILAQDLQKFRDENQRNRTAAIFNTSVDPIGGTPNTAKKKGKRKSNVIAGSKTRLSEQAALMLNIEKILNHETISGAKGKEGKLNRKDIEYKNFRVIRTNTPGHNQITNLWTKNEVNNYFFNGLPPQVLNLLVPSIKMYKVFYEKQGDSKPTDNTFKTKPIYWRIPFDDIPVQFRKQTSQTPPKNVEEILYGDGFLHRVGIKSFTYSYQGNNPATSNALVTAELKLFFENPEELVKEYSVTLSDKTTKYFGYSDLLNTVARKITDKSRLEEDLNPDYYRIKISCGYSEINNDLIEDILKKTGKTEEEIKGIINAITLSKADFYLSPSSYDISFTEFGSIELSIKYTASVERLMLSEEADIFYSTEKMKRVINYQKALSALIKQKEDDKDPQKRTSSEESCQEYEDRQNVLKEFFEKYKDAKRDEEYIKKELYNFKKESYNSIFQKLIGYNKESPTHDYVGVYTALIKNSFLEAFTDDKISEREQKLKQANPIKQIFFENINNNLAIRRNILPAEYKKQKNGSAADGQNLADQASKDLEKQVAESKKLVNKDYRKIKYTFLGDILDASLDSINEIENEYDKPKFILGEMDIEIPSIDDGSKHNLTINIADIPISMNLFEQFFIEKVIKKNRDKYPIMEFIKDIITDKILPAISPSMLGKTYTFNSKSKISIHTINAGLINGKEIFDLSDDQPTQNNDSDQAKNSIINKEKLEKIKNKLKSKSPQQDEHSINYVFIYCSSGLQKLSSHSEKENINNGIYHVRLGRDSGIIKNIAFKKSDIKYAREMIARREGNMRGTSIKQLYNADITMFGNNIYHPGDYIFIEPYFLTGNNNTFQLDSLGLGGYYMILKVNSSISESGFDTKLDCIFQASVSGNKKAVTIVDNNRCLTSKNGDRTAR